MGALAKASDRADPLAFEIRVGANGEWIVRGPDDRWGGMFVSQAAAEAFAGRETQSMAGHVRARSPRPNLTLVPSGRATPSGRPDPSRRTSNRDEGPERSRTGR